MFEAFGPLNDSRSCKRVIKFKVCRVLAMARPPKPEKHTKSAPRDPHTQNVIQKWPRSSQGKAWSAQGAPPTRPNRTLTRPGGIWEMFRTPQDLILELPRPTFPSSWILQAPQQPIPLLSSLRDVLSHLLSFSWDLGPGSRTEDYGPEDQGPRA